MLIRFAAGRQRDPVGGSLGENSADDDDGHADPGDRRQRLIEKNNTGQRGEDHRGIGKSPDHQGVAAVIGARHRQLRARGRQSQTQQYRRIRQADRAEFKIRQRLENGRADGAGDRELKHHAPLRLAGFSEFLHIYIRTGGKKTGGEADEAGQRVFALEGGAQQQRDANKSQRDRNNQAPAEFFPQQNGGQNGQEYRRGVVERECRRQRQFGHRIELADQVNGAGGAAPDMPLPERGRQANAFNRHKGAQQDQRNQRSVQRQFGAGEMRAEKLGECYHGGEQGARHQHPR